MQIVENSESSNRSNGKNKPSTNLNSSSSSSSSSSSESLFSEDASYLSIPSPPDGGYGWMIVFSAFMVNMISDGISFSFGILYIELLNYFGESKSFTSWVGSIFYGTCLMGGPIASALATKFGCRKVLMFGGTIATLGCFCSAFADSIYNLCFLFGVITGLGMSMGYVTSVVIVAFYFENKRALATGLSVCGSGIGTFVFSPLTEFLIDTYGWRGTMMLWSGIIFNLVVCGALLRPLEFTPQERRQRALQKFERLSRTVSFTSFSNTAKSLSRNESNSDVSDSSDLSIEDNILDHCHSQIQIPTFIREKEIEIPLELLKEAKNNKNLLKEFLKNQEHEKENPKKSDTVIAFQNGEEGVQLLEHTKIADQKPKGSCLKKSSPVPGSSKEAGGLSKENKAKHVQMSTYLPMYRKDLFFRGNLSRFMTSAGQVKSTSCPELYRRGIGDSDSDSSDEEWDSFCWRYFHFSRQVKRVLKTMFDPSILVHPLYVVFALSNFILYFWYDVPYIFMTDRAVEQGMPQSKVPFLISILGIVNTIGQIVYGILGDLEINLSLLYGISIMLCGLTVMIVPLFVDFIPLAALSGAFGLLISVNYALSTVILVEYLGLDKLSNAYGLTMMVQGIANLIGPPVAGTYIVCIFSLAVFGKNQGYRYSLGVLVVLQKL